MRKQGGSVLLVALTFLVVLSVLAIAGFQEVFLQNKIVSSRVLNEQLKNSADIALREGEMRLYSSVNYRELIDEDVDQLSKNCKADFNSEVQYNVPCLVKKIDDENNLKELYNKPHLINSLVWQNAIIKSDKKITDLASLPAKFNSYLISSNASNSIEWEEKMEGRGTYYYLVNAISSKPDSGDQQIYVSQSIFANYYPGLNN